MPNGHLDKEIVARASGVFERAADRLGEEIGDEATAAGLFSAWLAYTELRWGVDAIYGRFKLGIAELEGRLPPDFPGSIQ